MCGIAGFYQFRDDQLLKKISKQLSHRGPDGEGFYISDKASLVNRRLAIIDRKGGDQPIYNEDKSVVVTYNGEIYNYLVLRKELEGFGHQFKTVSDTEVIVHSYEQWQENCFDKFNGMFAIALYDIKKEKLVLARDHFGIKPLYYALIKNHSTDSVVRDTSLLRGSSGNTEIRFSKSLFTHDTYRMIFASEIKPIFESGLITKKPNDRIIYRYLKFRVHDDKKETFFDGIYRLMPGEIMIVQSSPLRPAQQDSEGQAKFEIRKYTNMKEEFLEIKEIKQLGDLEIEKFRDELIKAVRLRLIAEVPVGTCLSGGLDSSTIVLLVNQLLKNNVKEAESVGKIQKTFSAVFPGGSNNEEKYVDEVLKSIKLESHKVKPKPEQFFEEIEEFIKTQEEPTISTGPYAQYKVMQEASQHVTVLLDGQGSDEMMGGYNPYYFVYFRQLLKNKQYFTFLKEVVSSLDIIWHALIYRLIEVIGIKKRISIVKLLDNRFVEQYNNEKFTTTTNHLKKRLIEDIFANSLPSLLRYEDRNSMRFSIEGRVPFLDFNLLKYLFSLPDRAIINLGWNKNILRKSIKNLLPKLIVERRNKIGFTTPEYQWFMRMKNKIYQIFLSGSFANRKYFNQSEVLKAIQLFIEDKVDDTMVFWRLLNLELWLRVFFDPPSSRRSSGLRRDKPLFNPNEGKRLEIEAEGKKYLRYPVKTELFKKGDDYVKKITKSIVTWLNGYTVKNSNETMKQFNNAKFFLVISEKIVAISQGRSYFLWEIKPGFWANLLSKFVTKTPYGIGLGSSSTMQLAIQEVGLGKIIYATIVHQIAKLFGIRGMFYKVTGQTVRSIDGPTEYSLYPSNVSAKLGPKEPEKEAEKISLSLRALAKQSLKEIASSPMAPRDDQWMENFLGVVIIDANDLGQNVLGNSTNLDNKLIEKIFSDNPMGQADEQTPLTIVSIC